MTVLYFSPSCQSKVKLILRECLYSQDTCNCVKCFNSAKLTRQDYLAYFLDKLNPNFRSCRPSIFSHILLSPSKKRAKQQMAEPPPGYYPLLLVSTNGIPTLNTKNWDEWSSVLLDVLAPYEGVVEYLTGEIRRQGDCIQLEVDLLSLIQRTVFSELRVRIQMVTDRYGRNGSKVFHALQERHKIYRLPTQRLDLQTELGLLQLQKAETLGQYIDRSEELFFRVKKAKIALSSAREVMAFVKGLGNTRFQYQALRIREKDPDMTWEKLASQLRQLK